MDCKPPFYFSLFIALVAFTVAYCAITYFRIPLPRYYPTLNQWSMTNDPNLPSMGWYAQTIASLCVGAIIGGGAYLVGSRNKIINERVIVAQTAGWIAVVATVLMMLYIFQHEWQHWIAGP